jgi:hypothetical protein
MSDQEQYTRCPACGKVVDPNARDVRYAFELQRLPTARGYQTVDGLGAYFHEGCKILSGYRLAPNP